MKRHWKLCVSGKVQGVFYKKSAKMKADELQLSGWVRNEDDGSVYIEIEGREDFLKQFAEWCKEGPPNAQVEKVKLEEGILLEYSGFEIRRF